MEGGAVQPEGAPALALQTANHWGRFQVHEGTQKWRIVGEHQICRPFIFDFSKTKKRQKHSRELEGCIEVLQVSLYWLVCWKTRRFIKGVRLIEW